MRNTYRTAVSGSLAERLRARIDQAYGGNQRAFAAATNLSPQHVYSMLTGRILAPRPDVRRVLAREFGITHPALLVLTGELEPEELSAQEICLSTEQQEIVRVVADLSPAGRDALLALGRELLRRESAGAPTGGDRIDPDD